MMVKGSNKRGTLFFTSSKLEVSLTQKKDSFSDVAVSGLYSCTLEDDENEIKIKDEDEDESDRSYCADYQNASNGDDIDSDVSNDLRIMNLQFYVSSSQKHHHKHKRIKKEDEHSNNDDGNSYLYGATINEKKDNKQQTSWEILRADANTNRFDGFRFETYFRTAQTVTWNSPFEKDNSNCLHTHHDERDPSYLNSYLGTIPRAFAVDENTGEIFISWEGYHKDCNPIDMFSASGVPQWTVGISRLKNPSEDPTCFSKEHTEGSDDDDDDDDDDDLDKKFARCTEPVAIAYVGTQENSIVLPYGGLAVIPAATEPPAEGVKPRRSFLLSVFQKYEGSVQSHLWAISEGGDVTQFLYKRQNLAETTVHDDFMRKDVRNGGNIKLHYHQYTGRPDHVCRSVFDKGIACMPIIVTEDANSAYVIVAGDEEITLSGDQVSSFCGETVGDENIPISESEAQNSALATGLDVLWNEKDGTPQRIFFGCSGQRSNGALGFVDREERAGLHEMLPGAYAGDVVLLPRELAAGATPTLQSYGIAIAGILLVIGGVLYGFHKKRVLSKSLRLFHPMTTENNTNNNPKSHREGLPTTYMELPIICPTESSSIEIS